MIKIMDTEYTPHHIISVIADKLRHISDAFTSHDAVLYIEQDIADTLDNEGLGDALSIKISLSNFHIQYIERVLATSADVIYCEQMRSWLFAEHAEDNDEYAEIMRPHHEDWQSEQDFLMWQRI